MDEEIGKIERVDSTDNSTGWLTQEREQVISYKRKGGTKFR